MPFQPPSVKLIGNLSPQGGLGALKVRQGELRLNVAFAGTGSKAGLMVPTADSNPILKESLQEITLRLDQAEGPDAK